MKSRNEEIETPRPQGRTYLEIPNIIEICEKLLQNNINTIDVAYNLGKCYFELRDYYSAQNNIDVIQKENADHVFYHILCGHMNMKKGYFIKSYKSFLKAYSKIQNRDPFLVYGIGLLFEHIEKYDIACKWYIHLLSYNIEFSKYIEIVYRIAVGYKKTDKLLDAHLSLKDILGISKTKLLSNDIKLQLAHIYERWNDTSLCLEILDSIALSYIKKIPLYRLYAWVYYRRKEFNKLMALENNEDCFDPYILYLIARAYLESNDFQKSVPLLYTSIKLDQNMFMAYNTLGIIYYTSKNAEKSHLYFHKAVKIRPGFTEAVNNLRIVEESNRRYNPSVIMKEVIPDIIKTRYLDSQANYCENIYYATSLDLDTIQEIETSKMENL